MTPPTTQFPTMPPNPSIVNLTPPSILTEIPQPVLPTTCGPVSAKSYSENHVRPLVWLLFGGTGALGRQICRTSISRRDRVFVAALDEVDESEGDNEDEDNNSNTSHHSHDNDNKKRPLKTDHHKYKKKVKYVNPEPAAAAPDSTHLHIDAEFKHLCYRVKCDVRIRSSVDAAVQTCLRVFGRIDVVVNCFGYGVMGACEEQLDTEIRAQFETNVMGLFNTTRAVLPFLTNAARMSANDKIPNEGWCKKSIYKDNVNSNAPITATPGQIISFTSSMGVLGTPGFGPYSSTRWAAEGLLESLSFEVEHLGCKVTIIETGYAKSGNQSDDNVQVAKT